MFWETFRALTRGREPDEVADVAQLLDQLSNRLGGRRLYIAVIPQRWTDDQGKRLTRLVDWILEDDRRLTMLETSRTVAQFYALNETERGRDG